MIFTQAVSPVNLSDFLSFTGIGIGAYFLHLSFNFFKEESKTDNLTKTKLIAGIAFMVIGGALSFYCIYFEIVTRSKATGISSSIEYAIFQHRVANGNESNGLNAGVWSTRELRLLEHTGQKGWAESSDNQIKLGPGTYIVKAWALGYKVSFHKLKFTNIRTPESSITGMNAFSKQEYDASNYAYLSGMLTLDKSETFELKHFVDKTQTVDGMGVKTQRNLPNYNEDEIFATLEIMKIK